MHLGTAGAAPGKAAGDMRTDGLALLGLLACTFEGPVSSSLYALLTLGFWRPFMLSIYMHGCAKQAVLAHPGLHA